MVKLLKSKIAVKRALINARSKLLAVILPLQNLITPLRSSIKIFLLLICCINSSIASRAQFLLGGTVYDSSKINMVEGVRVVSTGGLYTVTDSMGNYHLTVNEKDSVYFVFRNKPTQKFSIKSVTDPNHFDISLRVTVKGKYSTLKEVVVHSKSYRLDSMENRQTYADVFDYRKPGLSPTISDGVAGADLDELINIFRFKRNKRLHKFQLRLEEQEREKYVSYRFNRILVSRITQLQGNLLDSFMVRYRPGYEFVSTADQITFNQWLLDSSYQFRIDMLKQDASLH